jgi:hypothetical protein
MAFLLSSNITQKRIIPAFSTKRIQLSRILSLSTVLNPDHSLLSPSLTVQEWSLFLTAKAPLPSSPIFFALLLFLHNTEKRFLCPEAECERNVKVVRTKMESLVSTPTTTTKIKQTGKL